MRLIWVNYFLVFFIATAVDVFASGLPRITLYITNHVLSVEVANTRRSRARGLMFRESLDENAGMLFVFPKSAYYGMWMKNTKIPLSVAFIDEKGFIINIIDMAPHSVDAHYSTDLAKYALEMNAGWFTRKKIHIGNQILGLEYISEVD